MRDLFSWTLNSENRLAFLGSLPRHRMALSMLELSRREEGRGEESNGQKRSGFLFKRDRCSISQGVLGMKAVSNTNTTIPLNRLLSNARAMTCPLQVTLPGVAEDNATLKSLRR